MRWCSERAGLSSGPIRLKTVGTPRPLRISRTFRIAGWNFWAKQKPIPSSSMHLLTPSAERSRLTPNSSKTSADPHIDDTERFPCLAMGTPHAAASMEAPVDMLTVCIPSPPVPTMSSTLLWHLMVTPLLLSPLTMPHTSSAVSPLDLSRVRKAGIWKASACMSGSVDTVDTSKVSSSSMANAVSLSPKSSLAISFSTRFLSFTTPFCIVTARFARLPR
mmetsp:Transcript_45030/g.111832  ORF Transcript_45030/g.111832 Transcript_45030/m.111832 type:complete len:219 (+) Transcript_45030:2002-2658(+)